ncbi:hypothetical protein HDU97_007516 [Phlyctochytrium planicorne]|nr:hypothetical protein HDU97_007516 [Phlyctochytrium planicorne]
MSLLTFLPASMIQDMAVQDLSIWIPIAATTYAAIFILPAILKIVMLWSRSQPIHASSTLEETAPLLDTSSVQEGSASFGTSIDSTLGDWEVLDVEELQSKPGNHWTLIFSGYLLAFIWLIFSIFNPSTKPDDSANHLRTIILTIFHSLIVSTAIIFCITDARRVGLRNAVEIERLKNNQRSTASFVIVYLILFDMTHGVGMAVLGLLSVIIISLPVGRLQRKSVDGLVPSPEEDASLFSRSSLSWMNPLFEYGYAHKIETKDLWNASTAELTSQPLHRLKTSIQIYKLQHDGKSPSLFMTLWLVHWRTLIYQLVLVLANLVLFFSNAFFVYVILESTPAEGKPDAKVYWYVLAMFAFGCLHILVSSLESQLVLKLGIRIQNVLAALIYEKSLRRAPVSNVGDSKKAGASVGKIVNLMAVDANTIGEWIGYLYTPAMVGLQILFCVLSLLYILGWSAIPGVAVLVATLFSGSPLASRIGNLYGSMKKNVDKRVSTFNEVVQGIKIIKFFAWERMFADKIDKLRDAEMEVRWKVHVTETLNRMLWYSAPFLTTLTTLGFYTAVAGKDLTASIAFTALTLFNNLRDPLKQFPDTLTQLIDSLNSLKRIEDYLNEDELESLSTPPSTSTKLGFSHASFAWNKPAEAKEKKIEGPDTWNSWFNGKKKAEVKTPNPQQQPEAQFELKDLNVEFPEGKVSVIIGATGSGKTALLLSLLGETHRLNGTIHRPSTPIAYVPQTAWLINATIRENILFGTPLDADRYLRVIKACCLERDLELLEGGDLTEIGEKGINLSGGQKQRIALARACYSDAPIVILDDPLSAVDAPTAKSLMEGCVLGLLRDRTRILVTNASGLAVPRSDNLYVIQDGRVIHQGPADSVITEIREEAKDTVSSSSSASSSTAITANSHATTSAFKVGLKEMLDVISAECKKFLEEPQPARLDDTTPSKGVLVHEDVATKLVEKEKVSDGVVGSEVYKIYFNAAGGWRFLLILVAGYSLNNAAIMGLDTLVYLWCKAYESLDSSSGNTTSNTNVTTISTTTSPDGTAIAYHFIPLYLLMTIACLAVISGRLLLLAYGSMQAGKNIHRSMMQRLVRAPMKFFEVTPMGRIVNRFTKDVASVDRAISSSAGNMIFLIVQLTFTIGVMASLAPSFILAILPLGWIYWCIGHYFISTSRSLKRIDSVSRSPIFSHFSETLGGVMVIRAFKSTPRFNTEIRNLIDAYSRINILFMLSYQWLSIRTQFLGAVILALSTYMILQTGVGRSLTGLCITFAIGMTSLLFNLVSSQGWLEANMNSMERCNEYLQIEQEAPEIVQDHRPPKSWPSAGRISIQDLRFKYGPDHAEVLRGVSCDIGATEKVAIVGRTGAGKSSLALALFRIVEPSGGNIRIDGVDILRMGLEDLRSKLTIIPQDPVLFAGTIRNNLDPFGIVPDEDLWVALKRSHLIKTIPSSKNSNLKRADESNETLNEDDFTSSSDSQLSITLDTEVAAGGSNLSAGQRQLLCLARAMARKSRVIVMDEATASVDLEIDSRIQETLREEFSDCTVITIAHRLKTIVDYDRVIVLDAGQVVENASPFELIEKGDGVFRKMCEETGEFDDLIVIAKGRHLIAQQRI